MLGAKPVAVLRGTPITRARNGLVSGVGSCFGNETGIGRFRASGDPERRRRQLLADRQDRGNAEFVVTVMAFERREHEALVQQGPPTLNLPNERFIGPACTTFHGLDPWPHS
jgi:hypothetical protein